MKKAMLSAAIMIALAIIPLTALADDVSIDANGNVTTGTSNSNANFEVTGGSAEDAVVGIASGTGASGVYGVNTDSNNFGLLGNEDYGVYGNSASGFGIYGVSAGGFAGYFSGNVNINGNMTVSGSFSAPGLDADTVDGQHASAFASAGHNHDFTYVNEGQANSVDGTMIVDGAITDGEISGPISGSKISSAGLDADMVDGMHASDFAGTSHNHDTRYYDKAYVDALEARIAALETLLAHFTRSGNEIYVTGANLNIRSGSGSTDGTVNGLGNVIIGYNEERSFGPLSCSLGQFTNQSSCESNGGVWALSHKTGSHNLIVGYQHNYSRFGGIVVGSKNTISGDYSSVNGGFLNTASGSYSSVSGGGGHTASGDSSSVSGGSGNIASGSVSSVSGGYGNTASGYFSSISGGNWNTASGDSSSVSGGGGSLADGGGSSVSGGSGNKAFGGYASVSGGAANTASGGFSSVNGGISNSAIGSYSFVGGGGNTNSVYANKAYANYSSILGGEANITGNISDPTIGEYATISGGNANSATARSSSVSGGRSNTASGWYSTVSGGNGLSATATDQWKAPGH